ncbi:MAG: hypothetical protein EOP46_11125 [Sphingobacteriaceae bacterium]|nr:MAG: hypothetical protein EOP46_11125 [Sphingobacteriaceae bacterium]
MKKTFAICLLVLFYADAFAQQTSIVKERIYNNYNAKYNVLTDSPNVKHGLYQAFFGKKIPVASGQYKRGKKIGIWHFYNREGVLVQHYDYNNNTVQYAGPADTIRGIRYVVDGEIDSTHTSTRAIKPGGVYFGYLPYISQFVMPPDLSAYDPTYFSAIVELLVSPGGRLADYKIRVVSPDWEYNKVAQMDMKFLTDEDKIFAPATINKQPVAVTIYIPCRIERNGKLEYQ